jgi:UDP-N-acetylglucosamine transferase subunit ALG13
MDRVAPTLEEPVVMQLGSGKARPLNAAESFPFASSLTPFYQRASMVVSHGGLGTIIEVLQAGKRLVGVSNPELNDQHQEDLLAEFEAAGYLIWCRDLSRLGEALLAARAKQFQPYSTPPCTLHEEIAAILAEPAPRWRERLWRARVPRISIGGKRGTVPFTF